MMLQSYKDRLQLPDETQFVRIAHDNALVAMVYKVTLPCSTMYILKICDRENDYLREIHFLRHFTGVLPVPLLVQVVPPKQDLDGALLIEYLPGDMLQPEHLTKELAYQIGKALARIHMEKTKGFGDLIQPDCLTNDPTIPFTAKFYEGIDECTRHLPATLIESARAYFESHKHLLTTVTGPCIIHRDFRPANMIICNSTLQGIIDWSSARAGFAEDDFCTIEHEEWLKNDTYKQLFLAGYASLATVPAYETIMPLLRLNRAIAFIGFAVKRGIWQEPAIQAGPYLRNRAFIEHLLGSNLHKNA